MHEEAANTQVVKFNEHLLIVFVNHLVSPDFVVNGEFLPLLFIGDKEGLLYYDLFAFILTTIFISFASEIRCIYKV